MRAKEYLKKLHKLDTVINQKIEELGDLRMKSRCVGSIDYSKERVQTSPSPNAPFVNMIGQIMQLEEEINTEIDTFVETKHTIINRIQQLPDVKHIELLYKKYVQFKNFETIAVEMNYSYQYIVELHGAALAAFEETYKNLLNSNHENC